MRILFGTLLFTLLAVISNCIVPDALSEVFQRHRQLHPISHGIAYYSLGDDKLIPISRINFGMQKIARNGFIIGVVVRGLLRPMYDIDRRPVIVRENDMGNTLLTPGEVQQIPYNSQEILDILPGFKQFLRQIADMQRRLD